MPRPRRTSPHTGRGFSYFRISITTIVALIACVCILGSIDPKPAQAFNPGVNWLDNVTTPQEYFRLRKTLTNPVNPNATRPIVTTASRAKIPALSRVLITRAGLAGVATGIWVHNGIMLYNVSQCGDAYCPPPLILDAQFRQAESAVSGTGNNSFFRSTDSSGQLISAGAITKVVYTPTSPNNNWKVEISYEYQRTSGSTVAQWGSNIESSGQFAGLKLLGHPNASPVIHEASRTQPEYFRSGVKSPFGNPGSSPVRVFGPLLGGREPITWESPVYDWGETQQVAEAPNGTHEVSDSESTAFANQVGRNGCPSGAVAAPEAPPIPEVCPDYFPSEWEEEWKEEVDPETDTPPQESPYGDPDQDGEPNHSDPDDDGDGKNDEEDDAPYVNPSSPEADPDEDGQPNKDDTDDDNDGIPDEDDPQPFVPTDPTTLPQDHPYADPDEDGEPNKDDLDDDGDGIPDEDDPDPHEENEPESLPNWHPYGDPDGDGSRNLEDKDDDNDDAEDWKDLRPFVPSYDPDTDTDDDGLPDDDDPWPGNPHSPADPDADRDEDGAPDYSDPDVENPDSPWGEPQNVPNRRPGPTGDPDTPSHATPWQNPSQGNPNITQNPPNEAWPPGNPSTQNPPDQSTGLDNPPPVSQDQPDDPTTETPNDPPPSEGGFCPVARTPNFEVPDVQYEDVFPFSLILYVWSALGELVGQPSAPSFDLGLMTVTVPASADGAVGIVRSCIGFVFAVGACLWFYRYITGRGSDAG